MKSRQFFSALATFALLNGANAALAQNAVGAPAANKSGTNSTTGASKSSTKSPSKPRKTVNHRTPLSESNLNNGKLDDGEAILTAHLEKRPKDDNARFELGFIQMVSAIAGLTQDFYRYGLRADHNGEGIPFLRIPIEKNPQPEKLTYEIGRGILDRFRTNLGKAEATLAQISDKKVSLPVRFGMIKLDLNGDGSVSDDEALWKLYSGLNRRARIEESVAKEFCICFDRGDVHWMRGYCNLLSAAIQVWLAYDTKELFDCTAHLFFSKVDSPYPFLLKGRHVRRFHSDDLDLVDLIAVVHLIRWNLAEPQRMESALHHLEEVVVQSRESWNFILAETDDDCEWLPNPNQTGVLPNVTVTEEMVTTWRELVDMADQALSGKKLIPFWRGDEPVGVNLRKVFLEPRSFDLVLWVQGTGAAPYLEKGDVLKGMSWRRLQDDFNHQFPGFAVWFN